MRPGPHLNIAFVTVTALMLISGVVVAGDFALKPESTLSLSGDSTLHPFTSRATQLSAALEVASGLPPGDLPSAILHQNALKKLILRIPVNGLKSGEGGLDKNMYQDLKAKQNPEITFTLSQYSVAPSTAPGLPDQVTASGTLMIAGQERPAELRAAIMPQAGGVDVVGDYPLLMTDYGIKPRTMMMGTIKVKNNVVIHYHLKLGTLP